MRLHPAFFLAPLLACLLPRPVAASGRDTDSPVAHGAIPDDGADDSPAFQRALEAIAAAGRGTLRIPPGEFHFTNRASVAFSGGAITIEGAGQGVTRLVADNPDGVFALRDESCTWQVAIRHLSLVAGREGAGTAISITSPHRGARNYRTLTIRDTDIRGDGLPTAKHFLCGIDATGQWRPLFENVIVSGAAGPAVTQNRSDDSPLYAMRCGFIADWCYAPTFEHCYAWSAHTGYRIACEGRPEGPEDASFRRCTANGVRIGIDIHTPIVEPQLVIDACHVNARDIGIRLEKRKFFHLTNNLMYGLEGEATDRPYTDILLADCYAGVISRNIFQSPARHNIRPVPPVDHTMIRADRDCRDLLISDNIFNAKGTAIAIDPGATNVTLSGNRASNPHARLPSH